MDDGESRREAWEVRREWPLSAAALLFLGAFAWPILDTDLPAWLVETCWVVTWVVWAAFVADYLVRLGLSRDRRTFVLSHLFDLVVMVAPMLRPLHLLRVIGLLGVLNRRAGAAFHGRVVLYLVGASSLVVFVGALAELEAERGQPGASITTFPDALWWAMTTVTTVGYGDEYPTTGTGRIVAAALMVAGIALLGTVTASVASWLVQRVAEQEEVSEAATRRDVQSLTEEVRALREEVSGLRRRLDDAPPGA